MQSDTFIHPTSNLPPRLPTVQEIEAAARSGPDCQPLIAEQLAAMQPADPARQARQVPRLTEEKFAARYQIPLGTLRDWEQGRSEPDQTARAYLRAIAGDAEAVRRALAKHPAPLHPAGIDG